MSTIEKLKEEEARLQAALEASKTRHAELSRTLEGLKLEMDELRVKFRSSSSQAEADRINALMYRLSERMRPVESQLSESEKAIKGARNALETVQRRLLEAEASVKGKWVVEYRRKRG